MAALKVEPTHKRIRAYVGGTKVFDSTGVRLVWEHEYYPQYYVPLDDVGGGVLIPNGLTRQTENIGKANRLNLEIDGATLTDAAWRYVESPGDALNGLIRFDWSSLDHWFEEDEEVIVHPRDPYKRVDVQPSSRNVKVEIDGVTIADSTRAVLLSETSLPPRWYLPKTDVRMDLLTATDTQTSCPYKGHARYWSATVNGRTYEDIVWGYDTALPESRGIEGLVCFYNEKVKLFIDGRAASL